MAEPTSLDLIAAQLAARGYYASLIYTQDTAHAVKHMHWECELHNDVLRPHSVPSGTGESALLAIERARQSLGLIEKALRSAP